MSYLIRSLLKSLIAIQALMLIFILAFSMVAHAEATPVSPDVVGRIIKASQLIKCEDNYCYNLSTLEELDHDTYFPDGVSVVFPVGTATPEELLQAKQPVLEFYNHQFRLWLLTRRLDYN